ncbi:MAG: TRCF domain-containing protein, partial [Oscillospiraceae bacterium]
YVPSPEQRMDLYRRIALIRNEEDADDLTDELIDRFGDPPRPVNNLISVALLRSAAAQNGISEIAQKGASLNFMLTEFDLSRISALCGQERFKGRLLFNAGEKPYLSLRVKKGEDALKLGTRLVEEYGKTEPKS